VFILILNYWSDIYYECQFEPTWGYDVSDVSAVNKILDDMIEEILSKGDVSYGY
jgi:hypothetical protein